MTELLPQPPVETIDTAKGPVEFARLGDGPPVLMVHGTPGGSDSSIAMGRFLADAGFTLIAPSRPGYLGTPLDDRKTIDQQADLHAALLDALGFERAGLIAWSGGGPSSFRLAVRHPDRISAFVAFACLTKAMPKPKEKLDERLMMQTSIGNWMIRFMADHMMKSMLASTLKVEGDLPKEKLKALVEEVVEDPAQRDVVLILAQVAGSYDSRRTGIDNDWVQFPAIETLELDRIQTPTLVINGTADAEIPPEYSAYAAATIPGAEHLEMPDGTHLSLFVHPDYKAAQQKAIAKLRSGS